MKQVSDLPMVTEGAAWVEGWDSAECIREGAGSQSSWSRDLVRCVEWQG